MKYEFENAQIFGKNFSGTRFNPQGGKRSFCLYVDDENVLKQLADEGITIRTKEFEDEEPRNYVVVNINFNSKIPPVIQMKSGKAITRMTEELVNQEFDSMIFDKCNIIVNVGHWTYNGTSGVSLYLDKMYVTILRDRFAEEFFDVDDDPEVPYV